MELFTAVCCSLLSYQVQSISINYVFLFFICWVALHIFKHTHTHTHTYTYTHTHTKQKETHPKVETLQVLNHNFKLMILEKEKPNKATNQGLHRCVASLSWLHFLGAPLRITLSVSTHPYMGMSASYGHFCSL